MELKWYIVHVYSGFEDKVKKNLEERIEALGQKAYFGKILVPTEQVVELRKGQKKTSSRKFYPGYILVQMALDKETWHTVNDTAKITGFVGGEISPTPISDEEVILKRITNELKKMTGDIGGDIAGIGNNLMIISPTGVKIDRRKLRGKFA